MPGVIENSSDGSTPQSSYADIRPGSISKLTPKLRRQFYPTLMLLDALSQPTVLKRRSQDDAARRDEYDPEQTFHNFVNRLALICHVEPNGDAVSSCAVVQEPDKVVFLFASNHRSERQLTTVAQALERILRMVPTEEASTDEGDTEVRSTMLREVLALSWCRLDHYLRALATELSKCIAYCQRSQTERDNKLGVALSELSTLVAAAAEKAKDARHSDREPFTRATELAIRGLQGLYEDTYLFSLIRRRVAKEHKQGNGGHWTELCHVSDRLKAYDSAIETIFVARDNWPELFDNFEVRFIPSPARIPNPLMTGPKTSAQLLGVTTSDQNLLPRLREGLQELQHKHNIDAIIARQWERGLRPTVHAEVQIHSWLESSEGGTRPEHFFGGYKFIGSSKPTCKLCSYYFEIETDVMVRPSHRNLYTYWRVPDLYDYVADGEKKRKNLMQGIKKRLLADISRTIQEKLADGRKHDSTDQRGRDVGSLLGGSVDDVLSSIMDDFSISGEIGDQSD